MEYPEICWYAQEDSSFKLYAIENNKSLTYGIKNKKFSKISQI